METGISAGKGSTHIVELNTFSSIDQHVCVLLSL
jgi:hypothetical protein